MLAHVAAFIVGASAIHADRPVADKFLRLHRAASLQDLDAAVGAQVTPRVWAAYNATTLSAATCL